MQIYVLIPIPSPSSTGPDPSEHVYHYTTGLKRRSIINSGCIKSTTAEIEPHEKPVAWFSTQDQWEPTATKVPIPGKQGQLLTARLLNKSANGPAAPPNIAAPRTSPPHIGDAHDGRNHHPVPAGPNRLAPQVLLPLRLVTREGLPLADLPGMAPRGHRRRCAGPVRRLC